MSTLQVWKVQGLQNLEVGTTGVIDISSNATPSAGSLSINGNAVSPFTGLKNRFINGAMVIDQRNAGAAYTAAGAYSLDRWRISGSFTSGFTYQQQTTVVPAGFSHAACFTTTSATTPGSGQSLRVGQNIEAFNNNGNQFGTSGAKTLTLSFWVRSSLTGTFAGNYNNGSNRYYVFNYTINSANTWEYKTVTIPGDTSGTWDEASNGVGSAVEFTICANSQYNGTAGTWATGTYLTSSDAVNVFGTLSATWYLTGVQLEVGTTATTFEYRPYGTELALCQRYYWKESAGANGYHTYTTMMGYSAQTKSLGRVTFPVKMRTTPTLTTSTPSTTLIVDINGFVPNFISFYGGGDGTYGGEISANGTGVVNNYCYALRDQGGGNSYISFSSEL